MRTNIDLDEALIAEPMAMTGLSTKKATVEEALRQLIRSGRQKSDPDHAWHGLGR